MHALRPKGRVLTVGALATTCVLLPSPAFADRGPGSSDTSVNSSAKRSGHTLESRITYSGSARGSGGKSSGNVTPVGNWTPPACWYEPVSAAEFKKKVEGEYDEVVNDPQQPNYAKSATGQFRDIYKDGKYKDYNLDEADEGNWWVSVQNPNRLDDPAAFTCSELPFWVLNGDVPPVKNAVTPRSWRNSPITGSRSRTPKSPSPPGHHQGQPAHLGLARQGDVHGRVRHRVARRRRSRHLGDHHGEARLPQARTRHERRRDLPGLRRMPTERRPLDRHPYAKGKAGETPPCGIKYQRSSGDGTFKLRATITWDVTWTGTGGAGGDLPDGTFGTTQDITVQEIQSVNR